MTSTTQLNWKIVSYTESQKQLLSGTKHIFQMINQFKEMRRTEIRRHNLTSLFTGKILSYIEAQKQA